MTLRSTRSCALAATALLAMLGNAAHAADISADALKYLSPTTFRQLSEDLGAAVSYKPMVPAEGLGLLGFDIGIGLGGTKLANRDALSQAAGGANVPSVVPLATLRAVKGLPGNVDIGVAVGALPSTNVRTYGGEVRWAFLPGNLVLPALALRGTVSNLSGVSGLSLKTRSVDLSISKGFAMVTPYAGIGQVWTQSSATTWDGVGPIPGAHTVNTSESFTQSKVFAGVNIKFGANLALETDRTGNTTSYGIKLGVRF